MWCSTNDRSYRSYLCNANVKFPSQDGQKFLVDKVQTQDFLTTMLLVTLTSSAMTGSNPKLLNDSPAGTYTSPTGMTTDFKVKHWVIHATLTLCSQRWHSPSKRQRLRQLPVPSESLSTRWNLLKTLKQSTVWMRRQNSPTFSPQRFLLRSTVKLFVPCM